MEFVVHNFMYMCGSHMHVCTHTHTHTHTHSHTHTHTHTVLFKDKKMADEILKSESPKEQKALGRKVSNFDPTIWGGECMMIVKNGNLAKVSIKWMNWLV